MTSEESALIHQATVWCRHFDCRWQEDAQALTRDEVIQKANDLLLVHEAEVHD